MNDFPIVNLEPLPFAYITRTVAMNDISKAMGEGFAELGAKFGAARAEVAGLPMAHYTAYDIRTTTFDLGFPCRREDERALLEAGLAIGKTPSGRNMRATHAGPYETVSSTYDAMTRAMKDRGLTPARDMWETYCSSPGTPPAETRTDLTWPVR